jgi:hypothetical protein
MAKMGVELVETYFDNQCIDTSTSSVSSTY